MVIEFILLTAIVLGLLELREHRFNKKFDLIQEKQKEWQRILGRQIKEQTELKSLVMQMKAVNSQLIERTLKSDEFINDTKTKIEEMTRNYELKMRNLDNEDFDVMEGSGI